MYSNKRYCSNRCCCCLPVTDRRVTRAQHRLAIHLATYLANIRFYALLPPATIIRTARNLVHWRVRSAGWTVKSSISQTVKPIARCCCCNCSIISSCNTWALLLPLTYCVTAVQWSLRTIRRLACLPCSLFIQHLGAARRTEPAEYHRQTDRERQSRLSAGHCCLRLHSPHVNFGSSATSLSVCAVSQLFTVLRRRITVERRQHWVLPVFRATAAESGKV